MALSGITFDPIQAYGKEYKLLALKVTIGAAGAVSAVDGKGWTSDGTAGTAPVLNGSVTLDTAEYEIVLPGSGAVHDILLLSAHVQDTAAGDVRIPMVTSLDLSSRLIGVTFYDPDNAGAPAALVPSNGSVLHFVLLVKNSDID